MFFGHIMSHSLLLPPAICLLFNIDSDLYITLASLLFGFVFSFAFIKVNKIIRYSKEAVLIALSAILTSATLIVTDFLKTPSNLMSYIVGDIILVSKLDIIVLSVIAIITLIYIKKFFSVIILYGISKEIAIITYKNASMVFNSGIFLQSTTIILQTKILGSLMVSSSLIIPGMLARIFSSNPKEMLFQAIVISLIANCFGFYLSILTKLNTSATIVICYGIITSLMLITKNIRQNLQK